MNKTIINLLLALMLLINLSLAQPLEKIQEHPKRMKRSFLSSFFWKTPEPSEDIQSIESSQTIFAVPQTANSNIPPSFVPVIPLQQFVSSTGQHFIAVRPVTVTGPNWLLDNLVEKPKSQSPQKKPKPQNTKEKPKPQTPKEKLKSKKPLNLTPFEVSELNYLARLIGVKDLNELPPLEDVMSLLGTTSKSETIKAIREYASTPQGLELIKDYVKSYQPVKRMDIFDKELSNNIVLSGDSLQGKPSNLNLENGYARSNAADSPIQSNDTVSAENTGFFAGLRSFFSFGSSAEPPEEAEEIIKPLDNAAENPVPVIGANYIPHFIIPMQPLVGNEHFYNFIQPDFQGYPVKPAIQDTNPFVLKPHAPQYVSTTNPSRDITDAPQNEAHIQHEDLPKLNVQLQPDAARILPTAKSGNALDVTSLDVAVSAPTPAFELQSQTTTVSTENSSTTEIATVSALAEITTPNMQEN